MDDAIEQVRRDVCGDKVVLGLSGGVDSSVVAALLSRAIGDQLTCVFVDNGLLRKNERQEVEEAFGPSNALSLNLVTVPAEDEFLDNSPDSRMPEAKRKVIGNTFIDVFDREAHRIEDVAWLAQGTIYPDVIESAASKHGKAHVIKSHHNVGGLPERMHLELVEPLRELFKDEVRAIGIAAWPAARNGVSSSVSRPGSRCAHSRRGQQEADVTAGRATHIFLEELQQPISTTRSARPLPCSCR